MARDREMLRFRWNHLHPFHRAAVKRANAVLAKVPLEVKYRLMARLRDRHPPYDLVGPGDIVVQVGAPSDTLHSGRSRGMHLALRSRGGRAVIIEPDPTSAEEFRAAARQLGLDHVTVVNCGAWYEPDTLVLHVDPKHPATNFTAGTVDYDADRMEDYSKVTIRVDTLDTILREVLGDAHPRVRLLSVTTNNAEKEILQGVDGLISSGLQYLSLARTGEGYDDVAEGLGFKRLTHDDRGFTYVRIVDSAKH